MKNVVLAAAFLLPAFAQAADISWPPIEKKAAVAACRGSVLDGAVRDYLVRQKLAGEPPGIREMLALAGEPVLAICDCVIAKLEVKWSFGDFMKHQAEYPARVEEILASGACPVPKMDSARQTN